jgi:paraquat-inducible protein A
VTNNSPRSPARRYGARLDVLVPLIGATIALVFGLFLPIVAFSELGGLSRSSYSVVTGIMDLLRSEQVVIGLILFTFSCVFPVAKLVALWVLWFHPTEKEDRTRALGLLGFLGKWSMLDVFVVALLAGALDLGMLAGVSPRPGVLIFSGAILLSMVTTLRVSRRIGPGPESTGGLRLGPATSPLAGLSLALLGAGLALPLMRVEKWIFWKSEYSIAAGTWAAFRDGHVVFATVLLVLLILLPLLKALCALVLCFLSRAGKHRGRWAEFIRTVDKWAMTEVFALAIAIVLVKLGDSVTVTAGPGLVCFLAAAASSSAVTWFVGNEPVGRPS